MSDLLTPFGAYKIAICNFNEPPRGSLVAVAAVPDPPDPDSNVVPWSSRTSLMFSDWEWSPGIRAGSLLARLLANIAQPVPGEPWHIVVFGAGKVRLWEKDAVERIHAAGRLIGLPIQATMFGDHGRVRE